MIPPRIKNVEALNDFCLKITYINGEKKIYDVKNILHYNFYQRLKNIEYF